MNSILARLKFLLPAGFVLLLMSIIFGGIYAYQNYSEVLARVKEEIRPDYKLVLLEQLNSALIEAEGNLQSFYLSAEEPFLEKAYDSEQQLQDNLKALKDGVERTEAYWMNRLDSNCNALLSIYYDRFLSPEDDRVSIALSRVQQRIEARANIETSSDTNTSEVEVTDNLDSTVTREVDAEADKKKGFGEWIKGIFSKKEREEKTEGPESDTAVSKEPEVAKVATTPDTLNRGAEEALVLQNNIIDSLKATIAAINREERKRYEASKKKLVLLSAKEKQLKSNILWVRQQIEAEEQQKIDNQTAFAEAQIEETNYAIAGILLLLVLLVGTAVFLVLKNLKNNARYQKALQKAKVQAEDLADTKSRFLANMSHELRTPLNAILGFTKELIGGVEKPKQKEQLGIVHSASQHLLDVVNEVLDYTKLNSNTLRINPENFELRHALLTVEQTLSGLAREKGLEMQVYLDPEIPKNLYGDIYRIRQCLFNLLGNAIKFTATGKVSLAVNFEARSEDKLRLFFEIKDTGVGIEKENLNKIFNEFEQINGSDQQKGTGLGMTITKRLVELMGGRLKVKSEPGKGTEVSFYLDVMKGKEVAQIPVERVLSATLKVLIADDASYNRALLAALMEKHGILYEMAENGEEALALASQSNFDAFLLDYRMPKLNGLVVARELRANANPDKVPHIAIISAADDLNNEFEGVELSEIELLSKPLEESALMSLFNKWFDQAFESKQAETGQVEGLDLSKLNAISNGNDQFIREMLEKFSAVSEAYLSELNALRAAKDYKALGEIAHKFAPTCLYLGFSLLHKDLKALEELILGQIEEAEITALLQSINQRVAVAQQQVALKLNEQEVSGL